MSLTSNDLQAIREVVKHELIPVRHDIARLDTKVENIEGKVEAQGNDIKEIYNILLANGLDIFVD